MLKKNSISRDHSKGKETSSEFGIAIMYQPALATVSQSTCSQMHVHTK